MNTVSIYLLNIHANELSVSVIDHFFTEKELFFAKNKTLKRRAQYFVSRFLLRYVLSLHCGKKMSGIDIVEVESGVPQSQCAKQLGLCYSISHSDKNYCVAIADDVGSGFQLGVDVELIEGFERFSRADFFCNSKQLSFLESLFDSDKSQYLCELWTQKEAVIKSFGGGVFTENLKDFSFGRDNVSGAFENYLVQTALIYSLEVRPICLSVCSNRVFFPKLYLVSLKGNGESHHAEVNEKFTKYYLSHG